MTDFFKKIAEEINHEHETGIESEINSFIEYQGEDINDFSLGFDKDREFFILRIETNDMGLLEKKQLFRKLVRFIEFPHTTFYTVKQTDKSLHYQLISYSKKNVGFVLDAEFF